MHCYEPQASSPRPLGKDTILTKHDITMAYGTKSHLEQCSFTICWEANDFYFCSVLSQLKFSRDASMKELTWVLIHSF